MPLIHDDAYPLGCVPWYTYWNAPDPAGMPDEVRRHPDADKPNMVRLVMPDGRVRDMKVGKYIAATIGSWPDRHHLELLRNLAQDFEVPRKPGAAWQPDISTVAEAGTQMFMAYGNPDLLKFATTAAEIERVYMEGPRSCMQDQYAHDPSGTKRVVHATAPYAGPHTAVAYIEHPAKPGKVIARAVVNTRDRKFDTTYGIRAIVGLLKAAGYEQDQYALVGCRLKKIEVHGAIVMPFLDVPGGVVRVNKASITIGTSDTRYDSDGRRRPRQSGFSGRVLRGYLNETNCRRCLAAVPQAWLVRSAIGLPNSCYRCNPRALPAEPQPTPEPQEASS